MELSSCKMINLLVLICLIGACSSFEPYIDRRREAGGLADGTLYVGESKPERPAVCYNKLYSSFEEVKAVADASCVENKTGSHGEPINEDVIGCTLITPSIYYFECKN